MTYSHIPRNFEHAAQQRPVQTLAFPRFDQKTVERNIRKVLGTKKRKLSGIEIEDDKFVEIMDLCFADYKQRGYTHFISARNIGVIEIRSELSVKSTNIARNRSTFRARMACARVSEAQAKRAASLGCTGHKEPQGWCLCMTPLPRKDANEIYLDTLVRNVLNS